MKDNVIRYLENFNDIENYQWYCPDLTTDRTQYYHHKEQELITKSECFQKWDDEVFCTSAVSHVLNKTVATIASEAYSCHCAKPMDTLLLDHTTITLTH